MNSWTAWQPWVIGIIALAVMLWFMIRALFADKARGKPRCLRCGHPFVESQGLTCTECGWTARRPGDLLQTRRHWGKAGFALAVMLISATTVRLIALGGNPMSLLPSQILMLLLPVDPEGTTGAGPVASEIRRRITNNDLSEAAISALVDVVTTGDASALPASDAWIQRYGVLADELRMRHAPPESRNHARLLSLPPRIEIETPSAWPPDEPVPVAMSIRDWWPAGAVAIVTLDADVDVDADAGTAGGESQAGSPWHRVGYRNRASIRRRHHFTLPATSTWPSSNVVHARLEMSVSDPEAVVASDEDADHDVVSLVTTDITVERPESLPRPRLEPWAGDAATDDAVADVFRDGLRRWAGTNRPFAIRFNPRRLSADELEGVFFGFVVEIVERRPDGEELIRRRTRIWMPGGESSRRQRAGWTISEEDTAGLEGAFDERSASIWLMRIRGDESLAALSAAVDAATLEVGSASAGRWWTGTVERPLRVESAEGNPFVRMWFRPEGVAPPGETD
jgi:ribosomal protein L37E